MTMGTPDPHLWRRVAALEKQLAAMEGVVRRLSVTRHVQTMAGRLWKFTLTSNFNESTDTASADLIDLENTDTEVNITVEDPLKNYLDLGLGTGNKGLCIEQLDLKGARHYVVVEWECP